MDLGTSPVDAEARLYKVFVAGAMGVTMRSVQRQEVIPGKGLRDDRYALGTGAYSNSPRNVVRHVTLMSHEAFCFANRRAPEPFTLAETRRNIITIGVNVNGLVGLRFKIGKTLFRGVELCAPCKRPSVLAAKPGFEEAFDHCGGLRAEVLSDGFVEVGMKILLYEHNGDVAHGLQARRPLCDFDREKSSEWPRFHRWVLYPENQDQITCPACEAKKS